MTQDALTPKEAYAIVGLPGLDEPIKFGRGFAESIWGVDGRPFWETKSLIESKVGEIRRIMVKSGVFQREHMDLWSDCVMTAAKARIYDLAFAPDAAGSA